MTQKKKSALCKVHGTLCLMEVFNAKDDKGRCPVCGHQLFRKGTGYNAGWTECDNPDGCDFSVLTNHIDIDSIKY